MNKALVMSLIGGLAIGLTACASTPTNTLAIQKENNQYEVTGIGKTNLISKNNAIAQLKRPVREILVLLLWTKKQHIKVY